MTNADAPALISATAVALWLGLIVVLHFIKPELDPRTRMISEYACARRGWVMQLAFFCVAISCWALAVAAWPRLPHLGPALLAVCGLGFAGAGAFVTDLVSIDQSEHTRSGALHNLFSAVVILLFPIMATVVLAGLIGRAGWTSVRSWQAVLTVLTWAGVIGFVGAVFYSARRPGTPAGYVQRLMVLAFSAWLIAIAGSLAK
jgi:hypothetical protein